jgi:hypothetical protein
MFKLKIAITAIAFLSIGSMFCGAAEARRAWYGPGSGPISPYPNFKGFAQLPRQTGGASMLGGRRYISQQPAFSGAYRCVPNVGLVGANGVCPD